MPIERQESTSRAAEPTTVALLFGATHACARCRLRFARRATCPECGATDVLSLGVPANRERLRSTARAGGGLLGWLVRLFEFLLGAGPAVAQLPPRRLRVHTAGPSGDAIERTGTARLGTVEITSAIGGTPCLAFGLSGATDDADIADADGGDLDLELDSGERMMVSLEHAVLVASATPPAPRMVTGELADLLDARAIRTQPGVPVPLEELLLRDGDRITITSPVLEGATVTLANGQRARVLAGTEAHPLAIRLG